MTLTEAARYRRSTCRRRRHVRDALGGRRHGWMRLSVSKTGNTRRVVDEYKGLSISRKEKGCAASRQARATARIVICLLGCYKTSHKRDVRRSLHCSNITAPVPAIGDTCHAALIDTFHGVISMVLVIRLLSDLLWQ